jgi:tRNA-modifying protein YgfZ
MTDAHDRRAGADWPASWSSALHPGAVPAAGLVGVADGSVAHFGAAADETQALIAGEATVVPLLLHGALRVSGDDRVDFVQGQVSNDVRGLAALGAAPALLLDHRGRPQADLTVIRRDDDLYLAVDDGRGPHVRDSLSAHVVFDQVEIHDLGDQLAALVVTGATAPALVARALGGSGGDLVPTVAASGPSAAVSVPFGSASVLVHARRRGAVPSLDLHLLARDLPRVWSAIAAVGARPAGEVALAAARVQAGIAASAAEGRDALPQEAGLADRVSYRKGCYLGQEIMARIEARGSLRRGLARLALHGTPRAGAEREVEDADGRVVGTVGTAAHLPAAGWQALAVLRLEVEAGAPLRALGTEARLVDRIASAAR